MKKPLKFLLVFFIQLSTIFAATNSNAETLRLTTLEWPPYYGVSVPENGFFVAIVREAYRRAGFETEVTFLPWKRALETTRRGHYDGLIGAYWTPDRSKDFVFSNVVATNEEVFIKLKKTALASHDAADLNKYTVGALDGAAQSDALIGLGYNVTQISSYSGLLALLEAKRVQMILAGRAFISYELSKTAAGKDLLGRLTFMEPPFKTYKLHTVITRTRSDADPIVKAFNDALAEMHADGSYKAILDRFGMSNVVGPSEFGDQIENQGAFSRIVQIPAQE